METSLFSSSQSTVRKGDVVHCLYRALKVAMASHSWWRSFHVVCNTTRAHAQSVRKETRRRRPKGSVTREAHGSTQASHTQADLRFLNS